MWSTNENISIGFDIYWELSENCFFLGSCPKNHGKHLLVYMYKRWLRHRQGESSFFLLRILRDDDRNVSSWLRVVSRYMDKFWFNTNRFSTTVHWWNSTVSSENYFPHSPKTNSPIFSDFYIYPDWINIERYRAFKSTGTSKQYVITIPY